MKTIKKIIGILLTLVLFFPAAVSAQEQIDLDKTGSLLVTLRLADGTALSGGSITVYPVADIVIDEEENPKFSLNENFASSNADLSALENSSLPAFLSDFASQNNIEGMQKQIDEQGIAEFRDIPLGLYLVTQSEPSTGYHPITSFLISVPNFSKENGTYIYEVTALPKLDRDIQMDSTQPSEPDDSQKPSKPQKPSDNDSSDDKKNNQKDSSQKSDSMDSSKKPSNSQKASNSNKTPSTTVKPGTKTGTNANVNTAEQTGFVLYSGLFVLGTLLLGVLLWLKKKEASNS